MASRSGGVDALFAGHWPAHPQVLPVSLSPALVLCLPTTSTDGAWTNTTTTPPQLLHHCNTRAPRRRPPPPPLHCQSRQATNCTGVVVSGSRDTNCVVVVVVVVVYSGGRCQWNLARMSGCVRLLFGAKPPQHNHSRTTIPRNTHCTAPTRQHNTPAEPPLHQNTTAAPQHD